MREHRRPDPLASDDDLLIDAVREVAAAVGPIVAELAVARARFLVVHEIKQRDLVVRSTQEGQPTAYEVVAAILAALEKHATGPRPTATGAHDIARRMAVSMGVAGSFPAVRRTRAQVDAAPNPLRKREGRAAASADQRVAERSERW